MTAPETEAVDVPFYVHFSGGFSVSVQVDAPDEETAIEMACEELPGGVCAQCSGWGRNWSRDLGDVELDSDEPVTPA